MMTIRILRYLLSAVLVLCLVACHDDSDEMPLQEPDTPELSENPDESEEPEEPDISEEPDVPEEPDRPLYASISLTEVIASDVQSVTLVQTYTYDDAGRLSVYDALQIFQAVEPMEIAHTTTLTYAASTVTMVSDLGVRQVYELDDEGFALRCHRVEEGGNERIFEFAYATDADGHRWLSGMTETVGDAQAPYSEVTLAFTGGEDARLDVGVQTDGMEQSYTLRCPADGSLTNDDALPWIFLTELYPLSFHAVAFYAGLLGDAWPVLPVSVEPWDNAESKETTYYTYDTDDAGRVTACHIRTYSYGQNYGRKVEYEILSS